MTSGSSRPHPETGAGEQESPALAGKGNLSDALTAAGSRSGGNRAINAPGLTNRNVPGALSMSMGPSDWPST